MARFFLPQLVVPCLAMMASFPATAPGQSDTTKKPSAGPYTVTAPPAYHTAVLGRSGTESESYAPGYDRRASGAYLSTAPTMSPPVSMPAVSSASPYSLSTYTPYYPPYPMWQGRTGSTLQGMASLTSATGQYYKDIQTARISREQSRQMSLETTRQRLQLQMDYEQMRPTALKSAAQQKKADLEWARKYAARTEISSGSTLNVLLKSCLEARSPASGPNISLEVATLKGINLTDKTSRGNLTLTKDEGKITWTEALDEAPFDAPRDRFSKNFAKASSYANQGQEVDRTLLRELRADLKALEDKLEEEVRDLPPSRYIESKRLLNQLKDTVKGLSDPRLAKAGDWRKNVRTVSDLVAYCMKNGMEFGPAAAPADYSAYMATYYALRSYEGELAR